MASGSRSAYNLAALRRVAKITDAAFQQLPRWIVAGMSERQLAWRMGRLLEQAGSQQRAFPVIVAFGSSAAEPHHVPTSRRLQQNELIKVDAGGVWQQMRGDVTRTWFFGTPTAKFRERYHHVYTAQALAFKAIQVGVSGTSVDEIARTYLRKHKLHKLFIHSLGHGVGRAIHQPPFLTPSRKGKRLLKVGEVVTDEPGVYEAGWGGIRIEDMVELTSAGPVWLSTTPRQLKQITLDY